MKSSFAILLFAFTVSGCMLLPPRRQYIREIRHQNVPLSFKNTYWSLQSINATIPDCSISIGFLEEGQLIIKHQDTFLKGDYLWYLFRDSIVEFHTTPLEKLAWTNNNCEINPSLLALMLKGKKNFTIQNEKITFIGNNNEILVFSKLIL